ncbi:MAG TPA: PQQ-dependent sugar dehydrogenase [Myxococcaceae bacterium]|nr:PQQ-dependent sugar dehydrogenase [Myxococcaceae bacterium]
MRRALRLAGTLGLCAVLGGLSTGCYVLLPSRGGGQLPPSQGRRINPEDVALPPGYRVEVVAVGLTFPTGVAFDDQGRPYVVEAGYAYGEAFTTPRLLRIEADGKVTPIAQGEHPPWNGVTFHGGAFFVAEGGEKGGGQILRITPDGQVTTLVTNLPGLGDHHTNGPAVGPDGWVYFGQGTATNAGVVGPDNYEFGWLKRHPDFHDTPCQDITVRAVNLESENPLDPAKGKVRTGPYQPFGTPATEGQVVRGAVPCNGAVMRVQPTGGPVELVAWGFRNPYGLAFSPDGQLFITENGYDERGSRPVFGAADVLWEVKRGAWHGWPDYAEGRPVSDRRYSPPGGPQPQPLLAKEPNPPPQPVTYFGVHSSSNGFDFSRSESFGYKGDAFVAQFGDLAPDVGKVVAPVGFKVVRVEVKSGAIHDFAINDAVRKGPASRVGDGGLERPIAARFDPSGNALYVVDFGVMTLQETGPKGEPNTGVLWRITRASGGDR